MDVFDKINQKIVQCHLCPRLNTYCKSVAKTKKRAYLLESYWGKPVPGFGDPNAALWIVGLAPAAHGANRTGRVFTGDRSGDWLYSALYQFGFSNMPASLGLNDGLLLDNAYISVAVRCAPPQNKPSLRELENCSTYLAMDFEALRPRLKAVLALGKTAFDSVLRVFTKEGFVSAQKPKFGHGKTYTVGEFRLFASYHPSQQNTFTGRLTKQMWHHTFKNIRKYLGDAH